MTLRSLRVSRGLTGALILVTVGACSGEINVAAPSASSTAAPEITLAPTHVTHLPRAQSSGESTAGSGETPNGVEKVQSALTSGSTKIDTGSTTAVAPFIADVDYNTGTALTRPNAINVTNVVDAAPMAVYQSQRFGNMTYTLPGFTVGKNNTIKLHFAETHWSSAGQRLFNVSINGSEVLMNFDTFVQAGGMNRAVVKEFTLPPNSSGQYVIKFTSLKDQAFISGIEAVAANSKSTNSPELSSVCTRPAHLSTTTATAANPALSSATIVPVIWNKTVPMPTSTIQSFGTIVESSAWLHWIQAQYGVGSVNMDMAAIPITPSPAAAGTTLTPAQVAQELANQIASNKTLPPKTPDLSGADGFLYMVYFPTGITLTAVEGGVNETSCKDFCGYHQAATLNGHNIIFAALPDLSVCAVLPNGTSCEGSDFVAATTTVASHELVEALTDPFGTGWQDRSQPNLCGGEVADLCLGRTVGISGASGQSVSVQQIFSNVSGSCELTIPGGPVNQSGFSLDSSSIALSGDLSDTSGLWVAQTGGSESGTLDVEIDTLAVSDTSFLTTLQQKSWPLWGDFDGDGLADMALVDSSASVSTIALATSGVTPLKVTNQGITTKNAPSGIGDGSNFLALAAMSANPPVVGDFNGDGRADIAALVSGTTIPIAYGAGSATGTPGQFWSTNKTDGGLNALLDTANFNQMHLIAADFNRDGRSDLAVLGGDATTWNIAVAISNGDGTFAAVQKRLVFTDTTEKTVSSFGGLDSSTSNFNYLQTVAGDFNGDGLMDIALVGAKQPSFSTIPIALGQADGNFVFSNSGGGSNASIAATVGNINTNFKIVSGDWDADGRWDLAIFGAASSTAPIMAMSNGDGTFTITPTNVFSSAFMTQANEVGVYVLSAQLDAFEEAN